MTAATTSSLSTAGSIVALLDAAMDEAAQGRVPDVVGVADGGGHRGIASGTQGELAQDETQLRLVDEEPPEAAEVIAELVGGRTGRLQRRPELTHRVAEHAADQGFLGREVVVKRRDVDADLGRDLPCPQAFEAALGDLVVGGEHEALPPIVPRRCRLSSRDLPPTTSSQLIS